MADLNSILNFAIPAVIIIFFVVIIAKGIGFDNIKHFFSWIAGLLGAGKERISNTANESYDIVYR